MKYFTSIVFALLISYGLNAQKIIDLGLKLQEMQKKFSEMNQQFSRDNKLTKTNFPRSYLKSAFVSQKLDSTVNQIFDEGSQMWQKDFKDEFLYDQQMRNTRWTDKEWNLTTHAWDYEFKMELTYNGDGLVSVLSMYDSDSLNMPEISNRNNYYYKPDGRPDSVQTWFTEDAGATWDLVMTLKHFYNTSKQLVKTETWNYDEDEGTLVLGSETNISYTGTGKIKTSISSMSIEDTEFQTSKTEYSYDASDRVSTIEYYNLNYFTLMPEKNGRDMFQYNANGDVSTQIYSSWSGADWIEEDKDEFEYNSMNLSDVAFPYFLALFGEDDGYNELKYAKAIKLINTFEKIGENWEHTDINTFYYSGGSATGIDEFSDKDFYLYPNPASESVTFNWKTNRGSFVLKMYHVTGAQVLEQNTWSGKSISVSHLVNGVYFYKLINGQQTVYSGKIFKR